MSEAKEYHWRILKERAVCVYCGKGDCEQFCINYASHHLCAKKHNYRRPTDEEIKKSNYPSKVKKLKNGAILSTIYSLAK
ncbi:MAG: hypothetical protein ACTSSH_06005 [Candidatus Heimdallarchaeota archaeon]